MQTALHLGLVFLGGGLGSAARFLVQTWAARWPSFPFGTLAVNLLGAFAMAAVVAVGAGRLSADARLFVTTGCLGGFTTYSAFNQEVIALWERGAPLPAFGYAAATMVGSLIAGVLGVTLARAVG